MTGHFDGDIFGVPGRILNLTDEFYGGLGRVAALASIVELRLSNVVVLWGHDQADEGKMVQQLVDRFKVVKQARIKAGLEMPDGLPKAISAAKLALNERNELLHSLWPRDDMGWRSRPGGTVETKHKGVPALRRTIGKLVKASDGLRDYLRSPIDPHGWVVPQKLGRGASSRPKSTR